MKNELFKLTESSPDLTIRLEYGLFSTLDVKRVSPSKYLLTIDDGVNIDPLLKKYSLEFGLEDNKYNLKAIQIFNFIYYVYIPGLVIIALVDLISDSESNLIKLTNSFLIFTGVFSSLYFASLAYQITFQKKKVIRLLKAAATVVK